jgi:hypothetical protein
MRLSCLVPLLTWSLSALACASLASAQDREQERTLSLRVGGTDHTPTGNDRWGVLTQIVGTFELGLTEEEDEPEGIIVIEGVGSVAGRAGDTELGPFGFGVRLDMLDDGETTRTTSRIGMYSAFPGDESPNVALVPLYAFGIDQPWLLAPGYVSVMGGGRFEERLAGVLAFAIEGTAALMMAPEFGGDITGSGVGALSAGVVIGPFSLTAKLSASFVGRAWALSGSPRLYLDFGRVWVEASVSATFAGTLPTGIGGYGADGAFGIRF